EREGIVGVLARRWNDIQRLRFFLGTNHLRRPLHQGGRKIYLLTVADTRQLDLLPWFGLLERTIQTCSCCDLFRANGHDDVTRLDARFFGWRACAHRVY